MMMVIYQSENDDPAAGDDPCFADVADDKQPVATGVAVGTVCRGGRTAATKANTCECTCQGRNPDELLA